MLLSCEVTGRVDTHTPTSVGLGKDPKQPQSTILNQSVPKSFVKALVTRKDGADLLALLVQVSRQIYTLWYIHYLIHLTPGIC